MDFSKTLLSSIGENRIYVDDCTAIDSRSKNNESLSLASMIQIVPNPTTGATIINSDIEMSSVQVYNIKGQLIHRSNATDSNRYTVDMTGNDAGIYILDIKYIDGSQHRGKLIKVD